MKFKWRPNSTIEVVPWLLAGCLLNLLGQVLRALDGDRRWISGAVLVTGLVGSVLIVLGISFAIRIGIRSQR